MRHVAFLKTSYGIAVCIVLKRTVTSCLSPKSSPDVFSKSEPLLHTTDFDRHLFFFFTSPGILLAPGQGVSCLPSFSASDTHQRQQSTSDCGEPPRGQVLQRGVQPRVAGSQLICQFKESLASGPVQAVLGRCPL